MEPLLNLPRDQFLAALAELQLDPERTAFFVEQYDQANAPAQGAGRRGMMYNLLDNIIGYDDDIVTPGERFGAGVQDFASGLLSDPLGTGADIVRGGYETIEGAMAPGATPMDVLGAAGVAMGAGGLLGRAPEGSLRIFAGRNARTADLDALERAQRLASEGADRGQIWQDTGWFQGVDGQWRFEIDDSAAALSEGINPIWSTRPPRGGVALSDAMTHDELLRAYPDFSEVGVSDFPLANRGQAVGAYSPEADYIYLRAPAAVGANQRRTMLHELQHVAQDTEGFAIGANPQALRAADNLTPDEALNQYRRTAGEVESRNVETRRDFTPEQRRATPPWETADVPEADQIVRFGSGPQSQDPLANLRAYLDAYGGLLGR